MVKADYVSARASSLQKGTYRFYIGSHLAKNPTQISQECWSARILFYLFIFLHQTAKGSLYKFVRLFYSASWNLVRDHLFVHQSETAQQNTPNLRHLLVSVNSIYKQWKHRHWIWPRFLHEIRNRVIRNPQTEMPFPYSKGLYMLLFSQNSRTKAFFVSLSGLLKVGLPLIVSL